MGRPPFEGSGSGFSASEVTLVDDLRAIHFDELTLAFSLGGRPAGESLPARLRVGSAHVRGLAPLGRASNIGVAARTTLLGASALVLAMATALVVIGAGIANRALAALLGALAAGGALLVFSVLERGATPPALYLVCPLAGLGSLLVGFAAVRLRRHVARRAGG